MDKLKLAQDYIIAEVRRVGICSIDQDKIVDAWKVADAMQAEAEERKDKTRPEALCEVDWRVAPQDTTGWKIKEGRAYWIDSDGWIIEEAPSFGFTGSHIVERPNGF